MTSVLDLFEEKARAQPEATAVSFAGGRVTYAELNHRANKIGRVLRSAGVTPEDLVAVFLKRSPNLIASLLGVWKAGGAYLPVDPENPSQRVGYVLEAARVACVLTERRLLNSLPPTSARVLCVEDAYRDPGVTSGISQPFVYPAAAEQLAYVIYTSGSTGKPKGAAICPGALLNVVQAIGRDLALQPKEVVLATASIAFDISNLEMYVPLSSGATIHLMESHFAGDGPKLIEMIRATNAALVFGTPTSWRLMLEAGWKGNPNLQIITGGEILPLALANTLTGITRAVWNHYGPTETSICATRERIQPDAESITLGRPIDNVRIYVLDEQLRQVAVGETGEIYIAGCGVGRGYLHQPELTARTFVPDPFAADPGARMYKTGDLGCLLPDGRLDFRGRADNQIKLRGFRIELEEIEAAVREFDGVHAACVQLVEYGADDLRLVAYFLGNADVAAAQLREFLRARLPFYMLPSELIPLESLPMTINGKIDRQALDAIRIRDESEAQPATMPPPSDPLEARLKTIWQKLLKIRNIGPADDFFDLGGHSLLATRMFAEIEKATGQKISLSVLISNPTIAKLAAYIRSRPEAGWPGLVPIRDQGSLPPLFIAHGLGGNLLLFRDLAEQLAPERPIYGIQLVASAHAKLEELTLEAFAARYVEEVCAVDPVGPYYLAGHSLGGLLVFEIARQVRKRGKEIGLLALLDCDPQIAQHGKNTSASPPVTLREKLNVWQKRFSRFLEGGIVNSVWRKVLYTKLMFKIWVLRLTHKEGAFHPQVFGLDAYIALLAESYRPQPIDDGAVLFVAGDELAPECAWTVWSQVVRGPLELRRIPGSHHTMLMRPHVSVLARELTQRLEVSSRSAFSELSIREAAPMNPLLECHGD